MQLITRYRKSSILFSLLLFGGWGWAVFIHGYITLGISRGVPLYKVVTTILLLYLAVFVLIWGYLLISNKKLKVQRKSFPHTAISATGSFSIMGSFFLSLSQYGAAFMLMAGGLTLVCGIFYVAEYFTKNKIQSIKRV